MDWLNKMRVDLQNLRNQITNLDGEIVRRAATRLGAKSVASYIEDAIKEATKKDGDEETD